MFGLPFFGVEAFEKGSEVFYFPAQREHSHFLFAKSAFQLLELPKNFAEVAFHGKRALGALFAASDGYVVETFSRLRKKKCVRIFECKTARNVGTRDDIPVAQLGQ